LSVDPEELLGLPHASAENPDGTHSDALIKIRRLLSEGSYVRAVEPGSLTELARLVDETGRAYQKNQGRQALEEIPDLIRRLHGAAREAATDADRGRAYSLLSSAYCLLHSGSFVPTFRPCFALFDHHRPDGMGSRTR
jgi:hypothetical protein